MRAVTVLLASVVLFAGCVQPATERFLRWSAPEEAQAGTMTTISWRVEGPAGRATHADVHAGPVSVKSPKSSSYPLTFAAANLTGPDEFAATALFPDEGTWFVRPHMVVGGDPVWGRERKVNVDGGVSLRVSMPPFVRADGEALGTYSSSREATATHFGVHSLGEESSGGLWHVGDGAGGDGVVVDYAVPLQDGGVVAFPSPGPGWGEYRMHVTVDGNEFWSAPFELTSVDVAVRLVDPPSEVPAGEAIRFAWAVEGAPVVLTSHTGIHFASQPWERLAGNVTVAAMAHEGAEGPVAVPGEFVVEHSFELPGSQFLRAHLRLGPPDATLDFFSDMHGVTVT